MANFRAIIKCMDKVVSENTIIEKKHKWAPPPYAFVRKRSAGTKIAPHSHSFFEFVYFFDGDGVLEYGDTAFRFSSNTYYLMAPGMAHSEFFEHTGKSLVLWFELPAESALVSVVQNDSVLSLYAIAERIGQEIGLCLYGYEKLVASLITEISVLLGRQQSLKRQSQGYAIHNIIAYIDEYYMTSLHIAELAAECNYSEDHFRILFRNITGKNPKEYLLSKRIALAKKLLKETLTPIAKISENCGFEYYSHFMAHFKKATGISPADYRRRFKTQTTDNPADDAH